MGSDHIVVTLSIVKCVGTPDSLTPGLLGDLTHSSFMALDTSRKAIVLFRLRKCLNAMHNDLVNCWNLSGPEKKYQAACSSNHQTESFAHSEKDGEIQATSHESEPRRSAKGQDQSNKTRTG